MSNVASIFGNFNYFKREKNVIRVSVEGDFHCSGFQTEWIELFNS